MSCPADLFWKAGMSLAQLSYEVKRNRPGFLLIVVQSGYRHLSICKALCKLQQRSLVCIYLIFCQRLQQVCNSCLADQSEVPFISCCSTSAASLTYVSANRRKSSLFECSSLDCKVLEAGHVWGRCCKKLEHDFIRIEFDDCRTRHLRSVACF